ncbi:hypothetical protein H311_02505 [Anncaliia algerae PRA109]|nr:hypothetical protein H311_02505 [Anncaliia algerae PRA109]
MLEESLEVMGGKDIDVDTGDSFFLEVIKRDAHTLSQIIVNNVERGSITYTDCWRGYINISNLGFYTIQ